MGNVNDMSSMNGENMANGQAKGVRRALRPQCAPLARAVSCYNTGHDRDVLHARCQDRRPHRPDGVSRRGLAPGGKVSGNEVRAWRGARKPKGALGLGWGEPRKRVGVLT